MGILMLCPKGRHKDYCPITGWPYWSPCELGGKQYVGLEAFAQKKRTLDLLAFNGRSYGHHAVWDLRFQV